MAHFEQDTMTSRRALHDGVLRCVLCADADPGSGHDWCPAAERLLCDGCCEALLEGDTNVLISLVATSGRVVGIEALARACSNCERASMHFAREALESDTGPAC